MVNDSDSKYTGKNLKLIQKAESFLSLELNKSVQNLAKQRGSKEINVQDEEETGRTPQESELRVNVFSSVNSLDDSNSQE